MTPSTKQPMGLVVVLMLGVLGAFPPSLEAQPAFVRSDLTAGAAPHGVTLADINADGHLDLIVSNRGANTISVRLGTGGGAFGPAATFATGAAPEGLAVADVNGDGRLDIVVANNEADTVSVLLGAGDGSFVLSTSITVAMRPTAVAVGDINGDGRPDLVVAARDAVSVVLAAGAGGFQPRTDFPIGGGGSALALGDVNRDGRLDVVVANRTANTVSLLSNTGGTGAAMFAARVDFATGAQPTGVAVGDVNGDGRVDVIVANRGGSSVSVLLGAATGVFAAQVAYPLPAAPFGVALVDINGDGLLDLALSTDAGVAVLLAATPGTFETTATMHAAGAGGRAVAAGDVDRDARPDIVVASSSAGSVSVLRNDTDFAAAGAFPPRPILAATIGALATLVVDVNRDGRPDLVVADSAAGTVSVYLGTGGGAFGPRQPVTVGQGPVALAVIDSNRDGIADVIVANSSSNTVSLLRGDGAGGFTTSSLATGREPAAIGVGDFNRDGWLDFVVANRSDGSLSVFLSNRAGGFTRTDVAAGTGPTSIAVADLNGDGRLDLVVANTFDDTVSVFLGGANTTGNLFPTRVDLATGPDPTHVVVADFNGDGRPDLAVANAFDGTVSIFLGAAGGTFQPRQDIPVGTFTGGLAVGDIDRDGNLDLVVGSSSEGLTRTGVYVLLGAGDGTFGAPLQFFTDGRAPRLPVVADVDADGRHDIVVANSADGRLEVLLNRDTRFQVTASVVSTSGGAGTVQDASETVSCLPDCLIEAPAGLIMTFTASPDASSRFSAWGGACSSVEERDPCVVVIDDHTTVAATFQGGFSTLTAQLAGSGRGTITDASLELNCPGRCEGRFPNTDVTLTATANAGSRFDGWLGCDSVSDAQCTVTLASARAVTATFSGNACSVTPLALGTSVSGELTPTDCPAPHRPAAVADLYTFIGAAGQRLAVSMSSPAFFDTYLVVTGPTGTVLAEDDQSGGNGNARIEDLRLPAAGVYTIEATAFVTGRGFGLGPYVLQTTASSYPLAVTLAGNSTGAVTANTPAINCGTACTATFSPGTVVTLTARPAVGAVFSGWSGACQGRAGCSVTMSQSRNVTATFDIPTFTLAVARLGSGNGSVTSSPGGIDCGGDCSEVFTTGTSVDLTAVAATGSNFAGWSGACTGVAACTVSLTANRTVTATFVPACTITPMTVGGTIAGSLDNTDCPSPSRPAEPADVYTFPGTPGQVVQITMTSTSFDSYLIVKGPDGQIVVNDDGAGGSNARIVVTVATAGTYTIEATTFALGRGAYSLALRQLASLTVTPAGTGGGVVTSDPAGISCGTTCSAAFPLETVVTLTAAPNAESTFGGWSGACSGSGACVVALSAARAVTATFVRRTVGLAVFKQGPGSVSSSPSGIDCGATCVASFVLGASVVLTPTPTGDAAFNGWTGACTGTLPTCTLAMNANRSTTATFGAQVVTLTIDKSGNGAGRVTSAPAGLDCGGTCAAPFAIDSLVTLTAVAAPGSTFIGWRGPSCIQVTSETCTVRMDDGKLVGAAFIQGFPLSITRDGIRGQISVSPVGMTCPDICFDVFEAGTQLTLTATATADSTFIGWSGACANVTPVCTVTMNAARQVTAKFKVNGPLLTVSRIGTGGGRVVSFDPVTIQPDGGIDCGASCNVAYPAGRTALIAALPDPGSYFNGWDGACASPAVGAPDSDCRIVMSQARNVIARFDKLSRLTISRTQSGGPAPADARVQMVVRSPSGSFTGGFNCPPTCGDLDLPADAVVDVQPQRPIASWGGDCAGSPLGGRGTFNSGQCLISLNVNRVVSVDFLPATSGRVAVQKLGTGTGTVTSTPAGFNCGPTCTAAAPGGTAFILTATPAAGSQFDGWSTWCTGTGTCTMTTTAGTGKTVFASFSVVGGADVTVLKTYLRQQAVLSTVRSSPPGLDCGGDDPFDQCTARFAPGSIVTLTALPGHGAVFVSWSGACTSTAPTCTVTAGSGQMAVALFSTGFDLTVSRTGDSRGTITSIPAGILCGTTCSARIIPDTLVTLNAVPDPGFVFNGWQGACTGTGPCTVTMDTSRLVSAEFVRINRELEVTRTGTGSGQVTSVPGGINCGFVCKAPFPINSVVTLTAAPSDGSVFLGWTGACAGTATCTVSMAAAQTVGARFGQTFAISVARAGTGQGSVTANVPGIDCGATCTADYGSGTTLTLTAVPVPGSSFDGWSGACSGRATCTLTLNAAKNAIATFNVLTLPLTVRKAGGVPGTVRTTDGGIDCGAVCMQTYPGGSVVELSALPGPTSRFTGWSGGGCSGTEDCRLTITAATTVTANFAGVPDIVVGDIVVPAAAALGQAIGVRTTVRNAGTAATGPFAVRLFLSPDPDGIIDPSTDIELHPMGAPTQPARSVTGLAAGQVSTAMTQVVVPPTAGAGAYHVVAVASVPVAASSPVRAASGRAAPAGAPGELNDQNNTRATAGQMLVMEPKPDLTSVVTVPVAAQSTRPFAFTVTVLNQGLVSSRATTLTAYITTDPVVNPTQTQIVPSAAVGVIAAGGQQRISLSPTLPANLPAGSYFVVVDVAPSSDGELDTTNNRRVSVGSVQITRYLPDLTVIGVSTPAAAQIGRPFPLGVTVRNIGPAPSTATTLNLYLTDDPIGDPTQRRINTVPLALGSIGSQAQATASYTALTVPDVGKEDSYFVVAIVNAPTSGELSDINLGVSATPIAISRYLPDPGVMSVTTPAATALGGSLTVTTVVRNLGPAPLPAGAKKLRLFLSQQPATNPTQREVTPTVLPSIPAIGPNATATLVTPVTVPADLVSPAETPSRWFAVAQISPLTNELSDGNNTLATLGAFLVHEFRPDLVVSAVSGPPTGVFGGKVTVTTTVRNDGLADVVSEFRVNLFLVGAGLPAEGMALPGGVRTIGGLKAGQSSTGPTQFTVPDRTPAGEAIADGTYTVRAVVDQRTASSETGAVRELSELNNARSAENSMTITRALPDLFVASVSSPTAAAQTQIVTLGVTINNAGPAGAPLTFVNFHIVADPTGPLGAPVRSDAVGPWQPAGQSGSSLFRSFPFTIPAGMEGERYVVVTVDAIPSGELQTSNNRGVSPAPMVVSALRRPDLAVSLVTAPDHAAPGRAISVGATITNIGPLGAPASSVQFYLTTNPLGNPTERPLGAAQALPALASGGSRVVSANLLLPATLPLAAYTVTAIVSVNEEELSTGNNIAQSVGAVHVEAPSLLALFVSHECPRPVTLDANSPTASRCTFRANAADAFGAVEGVDVDWVTSDSQVASVEDAGPAAIVVTGRKAGSVTIRARAEGLISEAITVTVTGRATIK